MSTATRVSAQTNTISITSEDVRKPMAMLTIEITAILEAAAHLARDFDPDAALVECSLLALNDVISAIQFQIYLGSELVREYRFAIAEEPISAFGPPPEQPPLGFVPDGAHARLVVTPNPRQPKSVRDGWFARLAWRDAAPLRMPETMTRQTYGAYASGGYGISRHVLGNPKFDRPLIGAAHCLKEKTS